MFQTGMTRAVYQTMIQACDTVMTVDLSLWRAWHGTKHTPYLERPKSVGIKGLPGLSGGTAGWRNLTNGEWYTPDPELDGLAAMVGDDVEFYKPYVSTSFNGIPAMAG